MTWNIKGSYYENCSCTNTCPCTWSSMLAPATNDYCRANLAFKISEGEINGVSMNGVIFVIIVDAPPLMADGNWKWLMEMRQWNPRMKNLWLALI